MFGDPLGSIEVLQKPVALCYWYSAWRREQAARWMGK